TSPARPSNGCPADRARAPRKAGEEEEEGGAVRRKKSYSQHSTQGGARDNVGVSSSDEETTVTTKVFRRRVILKGEQARNIPGESVTEEQFVDEDGNLVTRKVHLRTPTCDVTEPGKGTFDWKSLGDERQSKRGNV
ncbi:hypothetical protein CRUP_035762, partial [Coryphaenoides rupestris]